MEKDTKIPTKLILGGVAIIAILGGLYFFVFSGNGSTSDSSLLTASSSAAVQSADGTSGNVDTDRILQQLNELRRIELSVDFFNSPAFLSLQDFGVTINPQPIGRNNPFLPSTYVPDGNTIVPRANPAIPQPIGNQPNEEPADQPATSSATSSQAADTSTSTTDTESTSTTSTSTGSQATES